MVQPDLTAAPGGWCCCQPAVRATAAARLDSASSRTSTSSVYETHTRATQWWHIGLCIGRSKGRTSAPGSVHQRTPWPALWRGAARNSGQWSTKSALSHTLRDTINQDADSRAARVPPLAPQAGGARRAPHARCGHARCEFCVILGHLALQAVRIRCAGVPYHAREGP